jgi:phenylacetic acid degradation operon negative regulatory protein
VAPTARSLILDLLSTLRRGSMPVRALVAAGALFGLEENAVRVALARLRAAGAVERDERGSYRLGRRNEAVRRQVVSWREVEKRVAPWEGSWIGVLTARLPRARGVPAKRRERALRLLGFRSLEPGLELRPDNLRGGVAGVREELGALALDPAAAVFAVRDLDAEREGRARALWDGPAIRRGYADSLRTLAASEARIAGMTIEGAMVETFLVGGRVLRQIVLDPLLPEPFVPAAEREALVERMRRYDELGRSCWAEFLGRFDVPHYRGRADLRAAEEALHLSGVAA